jgi:hypothetical protein
MDVDSILLMELDISAQSAKILIFAKIARKTEIMNILS